MLKIQMDCCIHLSNAVLIKSDKIQIQCPHCFHLTVYDFNKSENRCKECSIIINEEEVYENVFTED